MKPSPPQKREEAAPAPVQRIWLLDVLPSDIFVTIVQYLGTPKDLVSLMRVCKRMKARLRSGDVWKGLYNKRWPEDSGILETIVASRKGKESEANSASQAAHFSDSIDWHQLYRDRVHLARRYSPLAIYTAAMTQYLCPASADPKRGPSSALKETYGACIEKQREGDVTNFVVTPCYGRWYFRYDENTGKMRINFPYLMEIWKRGCQGAFKGNLNPKNCLAVLVLPPVLFSKKLTLFSDIKGTATIKQPLVISEPIFDKLIDHVKRFIPEIPAISFVSAELCALYSCNTTTGIVAFVTSLPWFYHYDMPRSVWRLLLVEDSFIVGEITLWIPANNSADVIAAIKSLLKDSPDQDPVVAVARDFELELDNIPAEEITPEEKKALKKRKTALHKVVTGLRDLGLTKVKEVTADDILVGAQTYTRLPGFAQATIHPAAYVSTLKRKTNKPNKPKKPQKGHQESKNKNQPGGPRKVGGQQPGRGGQPKQGRNTNNKGQQHQGAKQGQQQQQQQKKTGSNQPGGRKQGQKGQQQNNHGAAQKGQRN